MGQRLGDLGAAGESGFLALVYTNASTRDQRSLDRPKCAGGYPDILQLRNMESVGLIRDSRKIVGMVPGLLLFVLGHPQARYLQRVVLADRKVDRVGQSDLPDVSRVLHARKKRNQSRNHENPIKIRTFHYIFLTSL